MLGLAVQDTESRSKEHTFYITKLWAEMRFSERDRFVKKPFWQRKLTGSNQSHNAISVWKNGEVTIILWEYEHKTVKQDYPWNEGTQGICCYRPTTLLTEGWNHTREHLCQVPARTSTLHFISLLYWFQVCKILESCSPKQQGLKIANAINAFWILFYNQDNYNPIQG